jgi:hypothetical protein
MFSVRRGFVGPLAVAGFLLAGLLTIGQLRGGQNEAAPRPTTSPTDAVVCESKAPEGLKVPDQYTPYELRRGKPFEPAIMSRGAAVDAASLSITDQAWIDLATPILRNRYDLGLVYSEIEQGTLLLYYGLQLSADMTKEDFIAGGGIVVSATAGITDIASGLLKKFPDRVVAVDVNGWPGAIVWQDPMEGGTRPYAVAWSDSVSGYSAEGARSPDIMVVVAGDLACLRLQASGPI